MENSRSKFAPHNNARYRSIQTEELLNAPDARAPNTWKSYWMNMVLQIGRFPTKYHRAKSSPAYFLGFRSSNVHRRGAELRR